MHNLYYSIYGDSRTNQTATILFSYTAQVDEDEDTVNLPHHSSSTSLPHRDDPSINDDVAASYDSTHFYSSSPPNLPLYDGIPIGRPELSINSDYPRGYGHRLVGANVADGRKSPQNVLM